jgi:hypothetical protein
MFLIKSDFLNLSLDVGDGDKCSVAGTGRKYSLSELRPQWF